MKPNPIRPLKDMIGIAISSSVKKQLTVFEMIDYIIKNFPECKQKYKTVNGLKNNIAVTLTMYKNSYFTKVEPPYGGVRSNLWTIK